MKLFSSRTAVTGTNATGTLMHCCTRTASSIHLNGLRGGYSDSYCHLGYAVLVLQLLHFSSCLPFLSWRAVVLPWPGSPFFLIFGTFGSTQTNEAYHLHEGWSGRLPPLPPPNINFSFAAGPISLRLRRIYKIKTGSISPLLRRTSKICTM